MSRNTCGHFLRAQRGVISAGHNDLPARSEFAGDLIGPRRQRRHKRHAHDIHVRVEIKGFDILIDDPDCVFWWRQRRHDRQRQDTEPQHRPLRHRGPLPRDPHRFSRRQHEQDFHDSLQ